MPARSTSDVRPGLPSTTGGQSAIEDIGGAGDERALVREQIEDARGDVVRPRAAAERRVRRPRLPGRRRVAERAPPPLAPLGLPQPGLHRIVAEWPRRS